MVFGNMGDDCATGVAFTRDPSTGENLFYGEYLINAQGEDVVAGIRTPQPLTGAWQGGAEVRRAGRWKRRCPRCSQQLDEVFARARAHYRDMQDIEFTIAARQALHAADPHRQAHGHGRAQDRRRHGGEGLIDQEEAVLRDRARPRSTSCCTRRSTPRPSAR